ncbi:GntR family transcriptional regulator [Aquabacter cavernae]|uniref:GntR family transcriptional regulator n=1 Tax=Aquabacter cavernae TaxID=2496029 RepID=UPI000F8E1A94|nr:GntR family transcriptional regulator [Aquabacter cavernae]
MAVRHSIKLIEEIADQIKAKILSGSYLPGERLKQERLAEEFGVSRTPIREALSRLEAQGLVSQPLRRSAVVTKPSLRDVAESFQVRAELEGLTARLAVDGMSDVDVTRLRTMVDKWRTKLEPAASGGGGRALSGRQRAWRRFEADFHAAVSLAAGNRNLDRVIQDLMSGAVGAVVTASVSGMDGPRMQDHLERHSAILDAIQNRNPEGARAAMVADVEAMGAHVLKWYQNMDALGIPSQNGSF